MRVGEGRTKTEVVNEAQMDWLTPTEPATYIEAADLFAGYASAESRSAPRSIA